ncbi:MAG: PEP-CTERM sorting domain-containing protein [Armatimonas sp.]
MPEALAPSSFLKNPGFENPVVGFGNAQAFNPGETIGEGWIVDPNSAQVPVVTDSNLSDATLRFPAPEGNQYLYVAASVGDATITQDVDLVSSMTYTLSFQQADFITPFGNPGGGRVMIDVIDLTTLGSVTGGPQLFSTTDFSPYILQSLNFDAPTTGSYQVRVSSVNGQAGLVDDFMLTPLSSSSAPEPGSLVLLTLSGVGILAWRRKRASAMPDSSL